MAQNFIYVSGTVSGAPLAPKLRSFLDQLRNLTDLGRELAAEIAQINGDIQNNSLPDAMKDATGLATTGNAQSVTDTVASAYNGIVAVGAVGDCLSRFG